MLPILWAKKHSYFEFLFWPVFFDVQYIKKSFCIFEFPRKSIISLQPNVGGTYIFILGVGWHKTINNLPDCFHNN